MATEKKATAKTKAKTKAKAKTAAKSATAESKATPKTKTTAKAKVKATGNDKISVTLIRSTIGRLAAHKACVSGLGLRRMHQTVAVEDTPYNRGMINTVSYLLKVEEA